MENHFSPGCALFDHVPLGCLVLDNNGCIETANGAAAELLGGDLRNKVFSQCVDSRFENQFLSYFNYALASDKMQRCRIGLVRLNGESFKAQLECIAVAHGTGLHMVITEMASLPPNHSDDAMQNESNFKALAEHANDGILIAAGEGINVYANPRFSEITGYSIAELLKIGIKELATPDERPMLVARYKKRLAGEDVPTHYETEIVRKDGHKVPIDVTASKTTWQGKPAAMVAIRDITAHKRIEAELVSARTILEKRVQDRTADLLETTDALERNQNELLLRESELENLNRELIETNKAITVLARNIEKNRQETETTIAKSINFKIMPIIRDLRKAKSLDRIQSKLDVLISNLQTLISELTDDTNLMTSLTPAEVKVATMIKNGLTNQRIADKLNVSLHTAKTHRRNIRKKLNIQNSSINLTSHLQSLMW